MMSFDRFGKTLSATVLAGVMVLALASCGGNDTPKVTTRPAGSTTTASASTAAPTTTTTLFTVTGTLASNDEAVTWELVPLPSATVKYVNISDGFLKVRKGPSKDYEAVAALTKNMAVTVVGKTTTNWYKTDDGFYVSGEYLSNTKG